MTARILLLLIFSGQALYGQVRTKDQIIYSGNYYYGTGLSHDENQARDQALAEISEKISVTVASSFENLATQVNQDFSQTVKSVINTYSTATLTGVESIRRIMPDGQLEIFSFIAKERVQEIYNQRKQLVHALYEQGNANEQSGNLGFALKHWYFGIVLMNSIPEEKVVVANTNMSIALPDAINRVLHNIRFEITNDRTPQPGFREIDFKTTYQGRPVSLLHYRFWDGKDNNGSGQVRDGHTTIRLAGASTAFDRLSIFPQYEYYTARRENKTVEELWDLVKRPKFENTLMVSLKETPRPVSPLPLTASPKTRLKLDFEDDIPLAETILNNTGKLLELMETGDWQAASNFYGNDAFLAEKLGNYMKHNQPRFTGIQQNARINLLRTGYEVRKLRVHHNYPGINKQSTEYLVLDFDEQGNLIDLNLCITEDLYDKFVKQAEYGRDWDQRQEIIKFVEKYRTAFHTRDIKTIDLMFAEEALILVGRRIETRKVDNREIAYTQLPGQPDFEHIQLTKEQYITRQKQVFDYQKDISIDFSTFEISAKSNAPEVYGVSMRQHYASTTYADEGYLFLLIDFQEKDPLIYIRAWQPNEWDTNALVNTANFRIFK